MPFSKGFTPWNKGISLSIETRQKLSDAHKGKILSEEHKRKISEGNKGRIITQETRDKIILANTGSKRSDEARLKMRLAKLGKPLSQEHKIALRKAKEGKHPPNYIEDRSKLKKSDRRNDPAYSEWRRQVWIRDSFKCKIGNTGCSGRIEAHHILSWSKYPELRYEINNGITLCHAHHPRKNIDEQRMEDAFQKLILESPTNTVY